MSSSITRRSLLLGAGALVAGGAGLVRPASAAAATGAQVVSVVRESPRDLLATVSSTALSHDVQVRVLLPSGYDAGPTKRYPVLYLLHGSNGDANVWVSDGAVRSMTDGLDLIVVMPDGGRGGWYSDHLHLTSGVMNWETFHTDHLVALVDENLRTIPTSDGRAIAGASMGGFGAAVYGGRHYLTYCAVSSYSGATDAYDMKWRQLMYSAPQNDGENAGAIFGATPGNEDPDHLRSRNPSTYAGNLAGHRVRLYCGSNDAAMMASSTVYYNALVAAQARDLGAEIIDGGGHDGACFDEALRRDLPGLLQRLRRAYTA